MQTVSELIKEVETISNLEVGDEIRFEVKKLKSKKSIYYKDCSSEYGCTVDFETIANKEVKAYQLKKIIDGNGFPKIHLKFYI